MGDFLLNNPFLAMFEPNPDNHPPIIYKYRNWKEDFHKDLLKKNHFFMASPSSLNDPFDCRIYENHMKFLKTTENKEEYIKKALENNLDYLKANNLTVENGREILSERLNDTLHYQVRSEVIRNDIDDKSVGIGCFSENWNSILMWSHYADNHKGYCVGFDEKRLRYSQFFGKVKRVEYSIDYPELNPLNKRKNSYELKYFYKSLDWEYEEEIRVMNIYNTEKPNRIIELENKHIKEVILGLKTSENDKKEIISIAKDKNIDVWETTKAEFKFEIERYKH
ncbi:MAG: DUF2971 domain-containing protein [Flavobacterium sp.]|uniref:DUF2971 domain-containing protein n=1 Tax=Flavobacterium sp. TaxID=239 RepID=UPI0022CA603A|nr:DUF2971 domain-containing protein [Flavobacterium sp.]MCZ8198688.1 DUF2971 domain-containing protein [Flavobacterium sp.]